MEVDAKGNLGENNTFNDTHIESVGNYNPSARTAITKVNSVRTSRWESYFENLNKEILGNTRQEIIDDLLSYKTKLDGTKDLEEKLTDGHFKKSRITDATRQKEMYAKKATKYECYPSAQEINVNIFARIKNDFDTYVYPLIEEQLPLSEVMKAVHEKVVEPILRIIEENGAHDEYLKYTEDHIYGMVYYLTGMCHLNWADYDNI